jgi:1,6-anhydro-N-acetylmuramate kinase
LFLTIVILAIPPKLTITPSLPLSILADLAQTDIDVAQIFAQTANQLLTQSSLNKDDIRAIGSHGQTIYHQGSSTTPSTPSILVPDISPI